MKTHQIEIQRVKAMNNSHGLIRVQVDALVQAAAPGRGLWSSASFLRWARRCPAWR